MRIQKIIIIFLSISLVLSVYLVSADFFMFNLGFYQKEFSKNNVNVKNAYEISKNIIGFFNDENELTDSFNEKESLHMQDVKNLVNNGKSFLVFLGLFNITLLSLLMFFSNKNTKELSKTLFFSGLIGLLMPLFFVFFSFSNIFEKFHLIFFTNGNWIFPASSLLIRLFPEQFFYDAAFGILINSAIIFVFFIILGLLSSKVGSN